MFMQQFQYGGRISILGNNFDVDQHFCTKFETVTEHPQPMGPNCSEIRFSKIQDEWRTAAILFFSKT